MLTLGERQTQSKPMSTLSGSPQRLSQIRTRVLACCTGASKTVPSIVHKATARLGLFRSPSNAGGFDEPTSRAAPTLTSVSPFWSDMQPIAIQVGVEATSDPCISLG